MNNRKPDQDYNKKKESQISIKFEEGGVIQYPLSTFYNIIECGVMNYILENQTYKKNVIDINDLINSQTWKKKYKELELQARLFESIINRLKRDLEKNPFAQPKRCLASSVNQNVIVTMHLRPKKVTEIKEEIKNSKNKCQIFTISDSEDDVIITGTSNIKSIQTKNDNIIDLIDCDDNTQHLEVKHKPAPKSKKNCKSDSEDDVVIITDTSNIKSIQTTYDSIDLTDLDNDIQISEDKCKPPSKSKTNVSIPDLKTNDNNKVLPINTEAGKTLSNGEYLSTTIRKRKPGPKSKTMCVSDMVPIKDENEETVKKKMCLNQREVINDQESNTKNLLNRNSVKKFEIPEKYNYFNKSSNLKYPPPYPLVPPHKSQPSWKNVPPIPNMTINTSGNNVTLTWDMHLTWQTAKIKMYELFVCQETDAPPNISMWKKKGNIEADMLPMACELEVFDLGYIYHFALRAVDVHDRRAPFAVLQMKI